mmetsp:Transcript_11485/g.18824  ORF Transcript_11485/g.18824 Transcript_11485/m.18824 type:complete len:505 (+) Transcript_11485:117-1631(+)
MSEQPTQLHADDPLVIGAEEGEEEEDGRSFGSLDASGLMSVVDADAIENVTLPTSWEFRDVLEFDNEKDLYSDEISMMHDVLVKKNNDNRKQQDAGKKIMCKNLWTLLCCNANENVKVEYMRDRLPEYHFNLGNEVVVGLKTKLKQNDMKTKLFSPLECVGIASEHHAQWPEYFNAYFDEVYGSLTKAAHVAQARAETRAISDWDDERVKIMLLGIKVKADAQANASYINQHLVKLWRKPVLVNEKRGSGKSELQIFRAIRRSCKADEANRRASNNVKSANARFRKEENREMTKEEKLNYLQRTRVTAFKNMSGAGEWFPDCWMAFALFSKPGGDAVCFKTLNGGLPPSKICADGTVAAEERRFLSNERGKVSGAKKAGRQQRRMEQVAAAKNGSVSEISGSGSGPAAKKPKMEHAVHHTISFMPNKTEELNAQIERKKAIVSLMEQMGKPAYQIKQAKEQLLDLMLKADANDEEEPEEDDVDAEGDDEDAEGDDQDEEDEDDE